MFKTILVPLDGSIRAEQALPIAARIARISGGSVVLLRVVASAVDYALSSLESPARLEEAVDEEITRAKEYLTTITHMAMLHGIETKTEVLPGAAALSILAIARESHANLIVMCSHGDTGFKRWMLGSVSQKVARHSPVPVLVLREGAGGPSALHPEGPRPVRVMVTLDGSPFAEAALAPAAYLSVALSTPEQGQLHLARVLRVPNFVRGASPEVDKAIADAQDYLRRIEQQLSEGELGSLNLQVTSSVSIDTDVAAALIGLAEDGAEGENGEQVECCDGIAMATHGRGGPQRWVMGSVTERVLEATRLPLLIVRPQKTEAKHELVGQAATARGSSAESEQSWVGLL
jgi:nucleotide-binding universal stress UspA family protein